METNWTEEEVRRYKENRKSELGPLYAYARIPIYKLGERITYLLELLNSQMTTTDYEAFMETAITKGRDKVLGILEDLTIQTFF